MVIYPPDEKFSSERKHITYYTSNLNVVETECFKLEYWHHQWESDRPIQLGTPCSCGKEKAIEDK